MKPVSTAGSNYLPLYWLALGTFAIGTEGFMIAALLPRIATDLDVTVAAAGQLISIFALSYAISSPVLTALTGRWDRKKLLLLSMGAFAVANILAAVTDSYETLAGARVLLACAAGIYTPNANALASVLVHPDHRGRAIAIVNGGLTVAIAIGVPLGALVGNRFGWRMTFVGVAVLAAVAVAGLVAGLSTGVGANMETATLAERVRVVRRPKVPSALLVTTLWAIGTYTVYSFVSPFLTETTSLSEGKVGLALLLWGASAGIGLMIGGRAMDRRGFRPVVRTALFVLALALASLSVIAHFVPRELALIPVLFGIALWGMSAWGFFPAQQAHLIEIVGTGLAPISLSLNASFMYFGFSIGAALGGFALIHFGTANVGWIGGTSELVALCVFVAITRRTGSSAAAPTSSRGTARRGEDARGHAEVWPPGSDDASRS
jgi:predicted MFS family arabinose efflux permease